MVVECWDKQCVVHGWMVSNIRLVILNVKLHSPRNKRHAVDAHLHHYE